MSQKNYDNHWFHLALDEMIAEMILTENRTKEVDGVKLVAAKSDPALTAMAVQVLAEGLGKVIALMAGHDTSGQMVDDILEGAMQHALFTVGDIRKQFKLVSEREFKDLPDHVKRGM